MATVHSTAKKNLTKSELKLFEQSFPKELKKISSLRAKKAHRKTAELVKKYRASAQKARDKKKLRMLNLRLKSLEKALDRYSNSLHKERNQKNATAPRRERKSLTAQPKMHVDRKDTPREEFARRSKPQAYDKQTRGIREQNAPAKLAGKRISGYAASFERKGRVARDRRNTVTDKE